MTEQEWLACTDPKPMLMFLRGKASDRKLRLFMVACYHHVWNIIEADNIRDAVEIVEQFADGLASPKKMKRAINLISGDRLNQYANVNEAAWRTCVDTSCLAVRQTRLLCGGVVTRETASQVSNLHDIFGNPFRPMSVDPSWLTWHDGTVPKIGQSIYEERRFQDLPVLADALEEAGCTNADILNHCRSEGPHVRGCWVVDLILGKQ